MQPVFTEIKLSVFSTLNYAFYFNSFSHFSMQMRLSFCMSAFFIPSIMSTISAEFYVIPKYHPPSNVEADLRCECVVSIVAGGSVLSSSDIAFSACPAQLHAPTTLPAGAKIRSSFMKLHFTKFDDQRNKYLRQIWMTQ